MRTISKRLVAIAAILVVGGLQTAEAGFIGMPRQLGSMVKRIALSEFTLPPMAFTRFCLRYPDQCRAAPIVFRGGPVRLTTDRWEDLKEVNSTVNAAIIPERSYASASTERWSINPRTGECHDYAVSKRAELLKRGWPARDLLLSEVVVPWGEHHLVLVVRTSTGDLVLDNLTGQIRPWSKAPYQWVRVQSPSNPNYWAEPANRSA